MKLIIAIINHDDVGTVTQNLSKKGFSSTRLSTTGGFLMAGNVTLLIGVEDEKVQAVMDIIREYSHSRKQLIPTASEMTYGYIPTMPVEVTVGGAPVFVVVVERFERLLWSYPRPSPTPISSPEAVSSSARSWPAAWRRPICALASLRPAAYAVPAVRYRAASTRMCSG